MNTIEPIQNSRQSQIYDFFQGVLSNKEEKELFQWIKEDEKNYALFDEIRSLILESKLNFSPQPAPSIATINNWKKISEKIEPPGKTKNRCFFNGLKMQLFG